MLTRETLQNKSADRMQIVPNDALIFELCREGNVGAIRRLLIHGHASLDDVNEMGETPLHVSL
jgi:hypothetical protein